MLQELTNEQKAQLLLQGCQFTIKRKFRPLQPRMLTRNKGSYTAVYEFSDFGQEKFEGELEKVTPEQVIISYLKFGEAKMHHVLLESIEIIN
ncbi:hypothetical protein C8N40_11165 [Pontibacter mucosus]|uniref:Uncharacterized protein n=1 Tax=Pontibacter mucosus TaxID=1649266 RepID=A0A2T5YD15_9BACT|nr:hypothetical protein [Pontibacter mucosus]PTX14400.1 hypothetical protein C8N40_11165 [Pontibacter mucosus]